MTDTDVKDNRPSTHLVTLGVYVRDPQEWDYVYNLLGGTAKQLGPNLTRVDLESLQIDTDDQVYGLGQDAEYDGVGMVRFDEGTLFKVREALKKALFVTAEDMGKDPNVLINDCINQMQNFGILFRERV
jgi:hypothetical protein